MAKGYESEKEGKEQKEIPVPKVPTDTKIKKV